MTGFFVQADVSENVSGFAWSDIIGWVSFNNTSGGGVNDYGVNIIENGTTGIFSGYVWSNNAGWIDFNEANLSGCPSGTCRAWVDKTNGLVYGWAKFRTTNDWLKLRGAGYGISISKSNGDFSGWAWGGETAGWVSFNCANKGVCSPVNYKVKTIFDMNIKPIVLPNPNPAIANMCSYPAYNFSWNFGDTDGDTQSKYQIQIVKTSNSTWVAGVEEVDTGIINSSTQSKEILLAPVGLAYNRTYKWRIMVWDSNNGASVWAYGNNFTTPIHIYPTPKFDWSPKPIIKDQLVQFSSGASECYAPCSFVWTKPANSEFASSTTAVSENPVVKFNDSGNPFVSLQITDNVGDCSTSTNVRVTLPLPKWKEILPQ